MASGPWLFLDQFTDTVAAGSLNNTNTTDGNAVRNVTADTNHTLSTNGSALVVSGNANANDDPDLKYKISGSINITRAAGKVGYVRMKYDDVFHAGPYVGWHAGAFVNSSIVQLTFLTNPLNGDPGWFGVGDNSSSITTLFYALSNRYIEAAIVLRATGAAYYFNEGYRYALVALQDQAADTGTPLWFGVRGTAALSYAAHISAMGVLANAWTRYCLASDSFVRANGAPGNTDGAGTQEAVDPTMAALAWTDASGTSAIASNAFSFSALTSSLGLSVLDPAQTNVFIRAQITYSSGKAGIVFKYVDANNHARLYLSSSSQITYARVVAGVETVISTVAITYSAGAYLTVAVSDHTVLAATYNYKTLFLHSTFSSGSALALTGTKCGLFTTSTATTFGSFSVFRTYETPPGLPQDNLIRVACFGDSETEDLSRHTGYLRQRLGDSFTTLNGGVGGDTTANAVVQARFTTDVLRWKPRYVIIQMGTNDIANAGQVSTVETNLQAWYTAAWNANITVIAVTLYPRKGSTSYTAQLQADMDAINAWIKNTATNVDYVVDMYPLLGDVNSVNTSGNAGPSALLTAYDSGDHLHLSQAGFTLVAQTIYTAVANGQSTWLAPTARTRPIRA